jgi:L-threonylcarbamoyladenylate synthase
MSAASSGEAPDIRRALAVLQSGGLVGLPTETVYGLAADASNPAAVARIFAAKGRPADHPVIVHLADAAQIRDWAIDIPDVAWRLAAAFWPGPMTLILKRTPHVLDAVTGGQDTVGLRVPSHPLAHAVLDAFARARPGRPAGIAAPSANKFGRVSPTTAQHVRDEFGDTVDFVLDGGACEVGIESTIIDCSAGTPHILRPGSISTEAMKTALGADLEGNMPEDARPPTVSGKAPAASAGPAASTPRVSGSLDAHYAPRTPTIVAAGPAFAAALAGQGGKRIAVLSFSATRVPNTLHWLASTQPAIYAHNLYANLRAMDIAGCSLILVEAPPQGPEWEGVNDRLRRAAHGSQIN